MFLVANKLFLKLLFLLLIVFLAYPSKILLAEEIKFKSGKAVEYTITEKTDEFIKVDAERGVSLTYYLDEIESIDGVIQNRDKQTPQIQNTSSQNEIILVEDNTNKSNEVVEDNRTTEEILASFERIYDSQAKFVPPSGKTLLIVGQDKNSIKRYINHVDDMPGGYTFYTSIQKLDGIEREADHGGGVQHGQFLVDEYPNSAIQIGLYMVGALKDITHGKYDQNIKKLALWIEETKRPVFLRIGYEFDNPDNRYSPGLYVGAYKRIAKMILGEGVDNVAFVWHSYASTRKHNIMDWYPGDLYVDWIAISYFNPYNTDNMDEVVSLAYSLNKPLMIAEATPIKMKTSQGEDAWKKWFRFVFKYIDDNNIKAFSYINCNWDRLPLFKKDGWGDARIEMNEYVKGKWIEEVAKDKYIKSSDQLNSILRYEPPVEDEMTSFND